MEQPSARYHHAAAKVDGKEAFIFGGFDDKRNSCFDDLYRYEYKALKFSNTQKDKVGGSSWIKIMKPSGTVPPGRRGHTMIFYKGSLILYGGITNKGLDDDKLYKYTIETRQWMVIPLLGTKPGSRVYHTMNLFKQDLLVIFGGKLKIDHCDNTNTITNETSEKNGKNETLFKLQLLNKLSEIIFTYFY